MSGFSPASDPFPLGPAATPNWPAGYVPPALEWSSWWSHKVDTDNPVLTGGPFLPLTGGTMTGALMLAGPPTASLQAATKAYVDAVTPAAGPFLPLSGGTMTGTLVLAGNPGAPLEAAPRQYVDGIGTTASQALTVANAAVPKTGGTMTGPLVLSSNPTSPLGAAPKQYVDGFLPLTGGNVTGSVNVSAGLQGNLLYANQALYVSSFNGWEWAFTVTSSGDKVETFRTGWWNSWSGTDGTRHWAGPAGELMSLTASGQLYTKGAIAGPSLTVSGAVTAATLAISGNTTLGSVSSSSLSVSGPFSANSVGTSNLSAGAMSGTTLSLSAGITCDRINTATGFYTGSFSLFQSGSIEFLQFISSYAIEFDTSNGNFSYVNASGTALVIAADRTLNVYGGALKPGGGMWGDNSDARLKDISGEFGYGLAAIRQLRPRKYRFKQDLLPELDDAEHVGFVAQEVEDVIPEMVTRTQAKLGDAMVDDLRRVDPTLAFYALIVAVQELAERMDRLDKPAMKA